MTNYKWRKNKEKIQAQESKTINRFTKDLQDIMFSEGSWTTTTNEDTESESSVNNDLQNLNQGKEEQDQDNIRGICNDVFSWILFSSSTVAVSFYYFRNLNQDQQEFLRRLSQSCCL